MIELDKLNSISDRIVDRELGDDKPGDRERLFGKRLKDGYAHYKRYLTILNVVSRHGFGYMFDKAKSVNIMPKLEEARAEISREPEAVRVRMIFEELGPTFIKIGQILSTRPDLVPGPFISEFENLRDDVAPMSFSDVSTIIEKELGRPLMKIFKSFDKIPVGAASIGQVHKAVTKEGLSVAVKVQRPGIKNTIMADMEILEDMAGAFGEFASISDIMDPYEVISEFKRILMRELDYTVEARSIDHFRRDFTGVTDIVIPNVYWQHTTKRVLTMDFIEGIKIDELEQIKKAGYDPDTIAQNLGSAVARMIFVKGYFHGDPHGGNILVKKGGAIAILDFGAIGYLDAKMRDKVRLFYFAIAQEDVSSAADIFLEICKTEERLINRPALEQDLREFLDFQRLQREGVNMHEGMNQRLISVAFKHNFAPPPQFILLERSLMEAEGVCRKLSNKFDLNSMMMPILKDIVAQKVEEAANPVRAVSAVQDYRKLMNKGPKKIYSVLEKLDAGEITIKVETDIGDEIRRDLWRIMGIMGVSLMAVAVLLIITLTGLTLETPVLHITISATPIIIIWLICVWWLYKRWRPI